MADLSAYIDFSVELNYWDNKIVLSDPNDYPVGVDVDLKGIFEITLPDGVTNTGVWTSPDIYYSGSNLIPSEKVLRLDSLGKPQNGTYTIKYTVDHPSYVPTVLTKTFELNFTPKTLTLVKDFDVFTPILEFRDTTNYSHAGWSLTSEENEWYAQIGTVGTKSLTNNSTFDLSYSGNYYDALYEISYTKKTIYTNSTYGWLTLYYDYEVSVTAKANTPPGICYLIQYLDDLFASLQAKIANCTNYDNEKKNYEYAESLLNHLLTKIRHSHISGIYGLITEYLLVTRHTQTDYVNLNVPILAYDLTATCEAFTPNTNIVTETGEEILAEDGSNIISE